MVSESTERARLGYLHALPSFLATATQDSDCDCFSQLVGVPSRCGVATTGSDGFP